MKKIMIQKITQNNWNFWTVNLIMRAKKIGNQSSDFPVRRTGSYRHKKALTVACNVPTNKGTVGGSSLGMSTLACSQYSQPYSLGGGSEAAFGYPFTLAASLVLLTFDGDEKFKCLRT